MSGPGVFDGLLAPVSAAAPAGESLRFTPVVDAIREARRAEDATLPRGVWVRDLKTADYRLAVRLCREALTDRSKDLLVAAWLVETAARTDGLARAAEGLGFLADLCAAFWETMHPEHDGTEDSPRFRPIIWLDGALEILLRVTPLTLRRTAEGETPLSWSDYAAARQRDIALRGGKDKKAKTADRLTAEIFLDCLARTPDADLTRMIAEMRALRAAADGLEARLAALAGPAAPLLGKLASAMRDVDQLLEPLAAARAEAALEAAQAAEPDVFAFEPAPERPAVVTLTDRRSAYAALEEVVRVLRAVEPHSPAIHLLARALRWRDLGLAEILSEITRDGYDPESLEWLLQSSEPDRARMHNKD
ncbi:MAG: type VI secretion system protein TssA [Pikeienuella sp.]|uniref:type VI secretion system protein TssA n=1 Tax=Pikeienuella sp. TaxID=2831957 RepID=UPI003918E68A